MAEIIQDIHKGIVKKCMKGNSKAQFELYSLYSKAMFNICYRMLNSREEAEDLLQEAFTEAFLKIKTFRFESTIGAWIKRIVVNKCINHLKKKRIDLSLTDDVQAVEPEEEYTDFEEREMTVKKVHKAIEQLPDGYRVILNLYLFEGYDHIEIAEIMGITNSTSKSQYSRAKQKLKVILKTQLS